MKMKLIRIKDMSIPGSILLSGLIIGLSVFLTTWIFFGGENNRQKLSTPTPGSVNKNAQSNSLTPQQIQMIQQQRAAAMNQSASTTPELKPAVVNPVVKSIKK